MMVCVYMPHAGYEDVAVEEVYAGMSELRADAKEKKRRLLAAGDFNAVVGRRRDEFGEDPKVVGVHGIGERNARGNMMVQWATAEGLCLITTQYRKQFAQLWTHKNGGSLRQIDHFVLEQDCRQWARNAESSDSICLGGDHRAVKLEVLLAPRQRRMRPQTKNGGALEGAGSLTIKTNTK